MIRFVYEESRSIVNAYIVDGDGCCLTLFCGAQLRTLHRIIVEAYNDIAEVCAKTRISENFDLCISSLTRDPESIRLINEIHENLIVLQRRGVSLRTIREYLQSLQTISRLTISDSYKIQLLDYGNQEVILKPLQKAVYILFLNHPEGITLKCMGNFREELLSIYTAISPRCNPRRLIQHVDNICNPLHNSVNEKISQINRAFSELLDESLLSYYSITGAAGSPKKVSLERSKIYRLDSSSLHLMDIQW